MVVISLLIIVLNIISFCMLDEPFGLAIFRYYTYCSNFLSIFNSLALIIFLLKNKNAFDKIPRWVYIFHYIVTICLTITMIVVFTVLIPLYGEGGVEHYLTGSFRSMVFHFIAPILSIISFVLISKHFCLNKQEIVKAILPTFLYAVILLTLNILKLVDGPYAFLKVYNQPVYMTIFWIVCILGAGILIAIIYYVVNKKIYKLVNLQK